MQKQKEGAVAPSFLHFDLFSCLGYFDVFCLPALGAFHDVEANGLAFLEATESVGLNRGVMDENVLSTLAAKKTKTFCIVEPLNCSLFHDLFLVNLECTAERNVECFASRGKPEQASQPNSILRSRLEYH